MENVLLVVRQDANVTSESLVFQAHSQIEFSSGSIGGLVFGTAQDRNQIGTFAEFEFQSREAWRGSFVVVIGHSVG